VSMRPNKFIANVILAMEVAQTFATSKTQSKVVPNVGHLHLAPSIANILLPIHSLHLTRIPYWLMQAWEFKQNITIEIHQKVGIILYVDGVIVQNFNLFDVFKVRNLVLKQSMTLTMVLLGFNAHWEMEARNANGRSQSR